MGNLYVLCCVCSKSHFLRTHAPARIPASRTFCAPARAPAPARTLRTHTSSHPRDAPHMHPAPYAHIPHSSPHAILHIQLTYFTSPLRLSSLFFTLLILCHTHSFHSLQRRWLPNWTSTLVSVLKKGIPSL